MICPRCGYSNAPTDESCGRCGTTLLPVNAFIQERRWVSSVFFDLSRFTEYALAHPLEDTWQAANTALQAASNRVRQFGGNIDKYFGDGFLAVFGVPRSQESDARAALEAAKAMVSLSPLPARAGVASGLVLRTPLGGGIAGDQTVLGPAINLSQRLSQAAPPGEVWSDSITMRLNFMGEFDPLPPQPLKGYAESLIAFRYQGLKSHPFKLVGRENERTFLDAILEEVLQGEGRRVVIHGTMGSGKTHLVQNFIQSLPSEVTGFTAPRLTTGVALRYALRRGLQELMSDLSRLRSLNLSDELRTILTFSIGMDERPNLPAHELDQLLVETWWHLMARLAQEQPLVLVLEDLHNADPTVLEFTRRPAPPGVMLIMIARQNRWAPAEDLVSLALPPLSLSDTQHLILQSRPDLGPATSLHLAEVSGGYPLAVQALSLTQTGEPEPIPLYQPRLDSLPRLARVALQAAAVLGQSAPPELVRHLVGEEADLARLVGEGFLETDSQGQLKFSIPWLREATLGQVSTQQAQIWHQQAARWYQRQERLEESATHLEAAGEMAAAYRLWRVIAQQTWNQGSYSQALLGYLEALRLAEGNVRMSASLEAAEAHLALGRYQEALELANLPLEQPDVSLNIRERAWAIGIEAAYELGELDATELPTGFEPNEPRLRLAIAYKANAPEARKLLSFMPPILEGQALLIRAKSWFEEGNLIQAQVLSQLYLDEYTGNPAQQFKARMLLVECLWRQFKLQDAREALGEPPAIHLPPWFLALYKTQQAVLMLEVGQLRQAGAELESALELADDAPIMAYERISTAYIRYLIEAGQLSKAHPFGETAVAKAPSPLLLAHLALAYALESGQQHQQMLGRILRGLEDSPLLEVRALCHLAMGLRSLYLRQEANGHLRKAIWLSRKAQNPSFYYYSLLLMGIAHQYRAPRKALALAQYLLSQTAGRGFEVQNGFARLLRAQLLRREGRESHMLLEFEPTLPIAKLWKQALAQGKQESFIHLDENGVLGVWIRWFQRQLRPQPIPRKQTKTSKAK